MNSKAFLINDVSQLENEILRVQTQSFQHTLAIVFGSVDCKIEQIPEIFAKHKIDMIGCSTSGEICNEEIAAQSISVLLMDLGRDCYTIQVNDHAVSLSL